MSIRVRHTLDDLAADMAQVPVKLAVEAPRVVGRAAREGNAIARGFARSGAGKHGKSYYKRLTSEMTGPLSAEYGPEGIPKSDFVGIGFRSGVNLDLPRSADIEGPKFADAAGDMLEGLFW